MTHEKVLKRPDGSQVRITVSCVAARTPHWEFYTHVRKPKSRKWTQPEYDDPQEVHEVMMELWEMMKPRAPR